MAHASAPVKTLIVAPAWVGDMVMAHAIVPGLVAAGAEVSMLAPPATAPLAQRMPGVAAVYQLAASHGEFGLAARRAAARRLAPLGFERAIVLPNTWKSALVPALARVPQRTGFIGEARFGLLNDWRRLDEGRWPRLVDRFAALAGVAPSPPRLDADAGAGQRLRRKHGLTASGSVVALCPGAAFGPAKRWPAAHFAALAQRCVDAGSEVWVLGGPADVSMGSTIAAAAPVKDLTGRTSLLEAVDLLAAATAVVSNDSGLMHVAAALGRPLTAIYGSTTPAFTPPLAAQAAIVERDLPCRPCFARECPLQHLDCLRGIDAGEVFGALGELNVLPASLKAPA